MIKMNPGTKLYVEKIDVAPGGLPPDVDYTPGTLPAFGCSLPIEYNVEGTLIEKMELGFGVRILRTKRNGIPVDGIFTTTPLKEIGDNYFKTLNSVYRFKIIENEN